MQAKNRWGGHRQVISVSDPVVGAWVVAGQPASCLEPGHLEQDDTGAFFFTMEEIWFTPFTGWNKQWSNCRKWPNYLTANFNGGINGNIY